MNSSISIWILSLPKSLNSFQCDSLIQQLSEPEKSRLAKIHAPNRRLEYLMGHVLLRRKTAEVLGIPPSSAPTFLSLSHTSGLVVFTLSPVPIGIDVEGERVIKNLLKIARRFFSPTEVAELESLDEMAQQKKFRQIWCLREALYKAHSDSPGDLRERFSFAIHPSLKVTCHLPVSQFQEKDSRWKFELFPFSQYLIALAVASDSMPRVIIEKVSWPLKES